MQVQLVAVRPPGRMSSKTGRLKLEMMVDDDRVLMQLVGDDDGPPSPALRGSVRYGTDTPP